MKTAIRCKSGKIVSIKKHQGWFEIYIEKEKIFESQNDEELEHILVILKTLDQHYIFVEDELPSYDISDF